jgi:hypothetical protein
VTLYNTTIGLYKELQGSKESASQSSLFCPSSQTGVGRLAADMIELYNLSSRASTFLQVRDKVVLHSTVPLAMHALCSTRPQTTRRSRSVILVVTLHQASSMRASAQPSPTPVFVTVSCYLLHCPGSRFEFSLLRVDSFHSSSAASCRNRLSILTRPARRQCRLSNAFSYATPQHNVPSSYCCGLATFCE